MTRPRIKLLRLLAAAPIAVVLALSAGCATSPGTRVGQFDFQYSASGAAEVRPYQVFDDGSQTFLQFDHPLPASAQVFINVPSGRLPQVISRAGELVSVPSIADGLTIAVGDARASVVYRGNPTRRATTSAARLSQPLQTRRRPRRRPQFLIRPSRRFRSRRPNHKQHAPARVPSRPRRRRRPPAPAGERGRLC
ncbi:TrbG/VirB9 family P-type conjugative transfer protein [Burkholderia glumae]|uniref:TrbG/VirB9 family P-type conjugative transfer protein n=1 Tax=Burkholderia glumae TaxID=337 RepID=UPI002151DC2C|nr:TrbG/VirB9 family P-type conjugative transfer protein [Burkholderia glumae]